MVDAKSVFRRWIEAMNVQDLVVLEEMLDRDFVVDYPQSGERIRGWEAFRAQIEKYPSGLQNDSVDVNRAEIIEGDERWAISPGYTVVPLAQPDRYTTVVRIGYPDGSWWQTVSVIQLRGDKIYRIESYFAPELPAPLPESIAGFGRHSERR